MSVRHIEHEINAAVAIAFQWDMTGLQSSRSSLTLSPLELGCCKCCTKRSFFLGRDWQLYLRMRSRLMLLSERLRLINFLNAPFVDLCRKEVRELATPFELEFG